MSILLVLTDLPQSTATLHSMTPRAGDCVFSLAKKRRLLRQVPSSENFERAWESARQHVAGGAESGFTSVLAVPAQDRRAHDVMGLAP